MGWKLNLFEHGFKFNLDYRRRKRPHTIAPDDIFNKSNVYSVWRYSRRNFDKLVFLRRVFKGAYFKEKISSRWPPKFKEKRG
jgi:hypothetical protein